MKTNRSFCWLLSTWFVGTFLFSGAGFAATNSEYHYYYFKEKRSLTLDADKVAIRQKNSSAPSAVRASLAKSTVVTDGVEKWPIQGWSLAKGLANTHPANSRRQLVSNLAGQNDFDFVSPVFIGMNGGPVFIVQEILVGFRPDITLEQADAILNQIQAGEVTHRNFGNMRSATCYKVRPSSKNGFDVLGLANQLAVHPDVVFAEPNRVFTGSSSLTPTDPNFSDSWGLHNTGQSGGTADVDLDAPEAWDVTTGNSSVIVAVLDTGVQQDHPDINQVAGEDVTDDPDSLGDGGPVNQYDNHGTAVAGCISGIMNNGRGTVGIAPGCRVLSIRTFISTDSAGHWTSMPDWTVQALSIAESRGARVSNNSNKYGSESQSAAIEQAYADTRSRGMIHFAAAGNSGSSTLDYPARLASVNAVAAINRYGQPWNLSNYGDGLAFSAPGEEILLTDRTGASGYNTSGDYVTKNGTSFASPYAAGVAALILSRNASLTADGVEQIMKQTCQDLGATGYDTTFGWGLVNANQAVRAVTTSIPQLSSQSVLPSSGTTTDIYTYSVHYFDTDGFSPREANVYIDGAPFIMTRYSGTDANGTYRFQKSNLTVGVHNHFFSFKSSGGITVTLPSGLNLFSGPAVSSTTSGTGSTNMVSVTWSGDIDGSLSLNTGGEVTPTIGATARYSLGDQLWFTALPSPGWQVDRWEQRWASPTWIPVTTVNGNSALMVVSGNGHTIRCIFRRQNPNQRILKISVAGPGQVNPATGFYAYALNAQASVTTTPQSDARFVGWTLDGADAGSNSTINVLMSGSFDHDLRATFAWTNLVEYTLDLPSVSDVTVSPTSVADAWNSYYNQSPIPVRYRTSSSPPIYEAFFKFDVSTLPADAIVSNVALHAYCQSVPASRPAVEVQKNTGDWSDTSQMTSLPGRTSTQWSLSYRSVGWHVFDLSGNTVQWRDWIQQEWMKGQNYGLRIRPLQELIDQGASATMNGSLNYHTREIGDPSMRPFVRVTYLGRRLVPIIATDKVSIVVPPVVKGQNATNETLLVRNIGEGTLIFTASGDMSWLNLSGATTGTSTNESRQLELGFNTASLAAGSYQAAVTITDANASNSPFVVPVSLTVLGPAISVSTTNIAVSAVQGESPTPTTLEVWNSGHGTLAFSILKNESWLTVVPASGTSTGQIQQISIQFASDGLNPRIYSDIITVTDTTGEATSVTIPVTLTVMGVVAAPTFDPPGSAAYSTNVPVSMFCTTPGAIIRYTLDGTSPNELSPSFTGTPIFITNTIVVRARAWKSGMLPSVEQITAYQILIFPPDITSQPQSLIVTAGTNAILTAVAIGTLPLTYQWFSGGEAILGATNSTLETTNVQPVTAGIYWVVVSNAFGKVTSSNATVTVTGGGSPLIPAAWEYSLNWRLDDSPTDLYLAVNEVLWPVQGGGGGEPGDGGGPSFPGRGGFTLLKNGVVMENTVGYGGPLEVLSSTVALLRSGTSIITLQAGTTNAGRLISYSMPAGQSAQARRGSYFELRGAVVMGTNSQEITVAARSAVTFSDGFWTSASWTRDGVALATNSRYRGQDATILTLLDVRREDAGTYVIYNSWGQPTPRISTVKLRVLSPAAIEPAVAASPQGVSFMFRDFAGSGLMSSNLQYFEVQASTNLFSSNWVRYTNGLTLTNGMIQFNDTNAVNHRQRFYRVIER